MKYIKLQGDSDLHNSRAWLRIKVFTRKSVTNKNQEN